MNHFIDNFNRTHLQTILDKKLDKHKSEVRDSFKWDASNQRIENVAPGKGSHDVSTVGQTLTQDGAGFKQGSKKFEFLQKDGDNWNAKKRKITDVGEGTASGDAVSVDQVILKEGDD